MTSSAADPQELGRMLGPATLHLVVLDYDGVLSPIVDRPSDAEPTPGVLDAVAALAATTSVAVVSGRPVPDLRDRLGELPVTVAGAHGAEIVHANGSRERLMDADAVVGSLDVLETAIRRLVDHEPGWLVERKDTSLAVHHRLAPPDRVEELLPRVEATLEAATGEPPGFELLAGKAVLELRPVGVDKGEALRRIAERTPTLRPLAVGDDITDEDAFRAAIDLGGTAVLVGDEDRETAATHRLADPAAVVGFLTALAAPRG